ncbi:MAG: AmmeMemoRadiSam system protein A, partial [Candidatus Krumholzibacteriia bacterium]
LAVAAAARGQEPPSIRARAAARGLRLEGALAEPRGVFVTLSRGGQLRGCIGSLTGRLPLAEAVAASARNAAVGDPRFPPVAPAELDQLELEISVLSPLRTVAGPDGIEVGRHGVLLEKDGRQAVFLPQVAPEQGWDRDTMLAHLARKAGLPADGWRREAVFRVFTADVF